MKKALHANIKDRAYIVPFVIGVILVMALLALGVLHIRVSDLQVPVRYTSFGITNFYTEQWFYQLSFMLFGIIVFIIHVLIAMRLYKTKGAAFAIAFQWFTVVMLSLILLTVYAIFRVADVT